MVIAIGLALAGVALLLAIIPFNYIVMAILIGIFGLGLATITIANYALTADLIQPTAYGTAFGLLFAIIKAGEYAASLVRDSPIDDAYQFSIVFVIIALALILLSIFPFFLVRKLPAVRLE